jgi:hypothetical protein
LNSFPMYVCSLPFAIIYVVNGGACNSPIKAR